MSTPSLDPAFEADGSLRDIYVAPADLRDWREALGYIRARGQSLHFTLSGTGHALPASPEECFSFRPARDPLLHFEVAGISLACHFFSKEELELDLLPNSVQSAEQVSALRTFLSGLANALGKVVRLTRENQRDDVLWTVPPTSQPGSSA